MLLLLNVSKKKDLTIYMHRNRYPSELKDEHEYAVGDIPKHMLHAMLEHTYLRMREVYIDANPFQYDRSQDKILYHPNFNKTNPDLFDPNYAERLDSSRVVKYTTLVPEASGPDLSFLTPYDQTTDPLEDRIDFVFPAAQWQYRKPEVHIGVYNSRADKQPVTFDI